MRCINCGVEYEDERCPRCGLSERYCRVLYRYEERQREKQSGNYRPRKKESLFQKWWFWVIILCVAFMAYSGSQSSKRELQSEYDKLAEERNALVLERDDALLQLDEMNKEYNSLKEDASVFLKMTENEQAAELARAEKERIEEEEAARVAKEEADKIAAERKAEEEKKREAEREEWLKENTIELSSGNYVAGTDFKAGTYDIVAVKGGGNVQSSNMFSGGINAILGDDDYVREYEDFYQKEYKNIRLPSGTDLMVSGVTIQLIPK